MTNRFWVILTLFISLTGSAVFAEQGYYYSCTREDNADDWIIEIDLKRHKLALWDNDSWAFADLVSVLESLPPSYLFESARKDDPWEIWFRTNYEGDEGTATLNVGARNIEFNCVKEKKLSGNFDFDEPVKREPQKFSCSNVGGTEEWTIYVDLKKKLAEFFDNDTTTVVDLKEVKTLKSRPPQELYIFEGEDAGGGDGERLRITFNRTALKGSVTFINSRSKERTLKALDGCVANEKITLRKARR